MDNNSHVSLGSVTEDSMFDGTTYHKQIYEMSSSDYSTEQKSSVYRGPTTPAKFLNKGVHLGSCSEGRRPRSAGEFLTPRAGESHSEWEQIIDEDGNNIQPSPKPSLQSASQVRLIILAMFYFIISLVLTIVTVVAIFV